MRFQTGPEIWQESRNCTFTLLPTAKFLDVWGAQQSG